MSKLTSHRSGVPTARNEPKFKGFRRTHWYVGGAALDREMVHRDMGGTPRVLTRTWRQGEYVHPSSMMK